MTELIEYLYTKCYHSTLTHVEIENRIHAVHKADKERKRLTEIIAAMPKYQKKKIFKIS
jgi:hypothetical protein